MAAKTDFIDESPLLILRNLLKAMSGSMFPAYTLADRELQLWLWSLLFSRRAQSASRKFVLSDENLLPYASLQMAHTRKGARFDPNYPSA